jgi:hypothetical protein
MIFYHAIGLGVACAVFLSESGRGAWSRGFLVATAVVFWPLYVPILLSRPRPATPSDRPPLVSAGDAMSEAIRQVEAELETALASLDGWAEGILGREADRFRELSTAWHAQAGRIREMDRLLARAEPIDRDPVRSASGLEASDRCRRSERARRANLGRLRQVRGRAYEDLMGMLAWVRELVSMIHLAKFTGAPASRAEELVAQIAAAVEGISAVTWQDVLAEPAVCPPGAEPIPTRSQWEAEPCDSSRASVISSPRT